MQFAMTTYYRVEFLPPVIAFVAEIARCLGASPKEVSELSMASEEAGAYIIERYPSDGFAEQFEVSCQVEPDGLRVVFSNMGLPVDPEGLPRYEISQPEETIDGLGLFLIEKLVDELDFVNRGREGWRTVLFKRFAHPKPLAQTAHAAEAGTPATREKLQVQIAGIEHVPGIVELAYRNYGYSYSKELFYYADQLQAAITDGRVTSYIALNAQNRVAGQMAILRSPDTPDVAEYGALMVQPEYRRSMGLLHLVKAVARTTKDPVTAPAIGEANLVTTHTQSQKVSSLFNFAPMGLKLSVHDRARFLKLAEQADDQRETLLHAITANRPVEPFALYCPTPHQEITRRLFGNAELPAEIQSESDGAPEASALKVERHAEDGFAIVSLMTPGRDFARVLRRQLFELEADGMKTVLVRVPGWMPQPADLEDEARALRLFFSGWIAQGPDQWWLQYTRLYSQRFDFDRIQLADPVAIELQTYVAQCFQEAVFA